MASPNKTRVQVATDSAFSNIVHDVEGAYTTALQIAEEVLPQGVNLYARGMHGHPTTGDSSWSTTVQFQIKIAWSDWDGSANGLEYSLNSSQSLYISTVSIGDDKILVSYRNFNDSNYLYAVVVTLQGSVIMTGSPVRCNTSSSNWIDSVALSDNKVVISYANGYDSNYLWSILLDIENDTITPNPSVRCHSMVVAEVALAKLTETKALLVYSNNNPSGDRSIYANVLSIDTGNITSGSAIKCNSTICDNIRITALSSTKAIVCYCDRVNLDYLYSLVLNVNGTTLSTTAPVRCNTHYSIHLHTALIAPMKVLVGYRNYSDNNILYAVVLSINNNSISAGVPKKCNGSHSEFIRIVVLNEDKAMICYRNNSSGGHLYSLILLISNTTIVTQGIAVPCTVSSIGGWTVSDIAAIAIGNKVFVAYNKGANTTLYGKVLVG